MKITKRILEYVTLIGLFAVPFIPFLISSTMFFPFITGKGFVFRILIEVLAGVFVFLAVIAPEYRPKLSWITKSIGLFALIILLADLFGANAYKSLWSNYERMEGFVLIAHLVLYYFVASGMFKTISKWNQFFNVSILASLIMSFYGVLQLAGKITINQGGVRLDATFGNSAYLAIYLVFHIFLCLYMLAQANRAVWQRWAYGAVALLEASMLYFTATRGAILGLIGGLILAALIIALKEKENKQLKKAAYVVLGGVLLVVVGFFALRSTPFVQKSPVLSRFASMGASEIKTQGRYFIWPMALQGVKERPLLGWGQENFNFVFNEHYSPEMYAQEQWFDRTHNIVLDWLIAGGILGFLAYASLYIAFFYYIWRKESTLTLTEKSIFTGMVSAYVFHNMFVFDNIASYILFFSLLAFAHSISVFRATPKGAFATKEISSDVTNYAIAPIIAIVTILAIYFVNVPAIEANTTLIQAISPQQNEGPTKNLELFKQVFAYNSFGSAEALEQLIQVGSQITTSQVPDSVKAEFYTFTKAKIEEKIAQSPNDVRYLVFAGSFFNRVGAYDEALKYLNKALLLSPQKQSIYFETGTAYIGKKDYATAFSLFKKAYDLEPNAPDSKIVYAVGAIYTKDQTIIKQALSLVSLSDVIFDNRFLRAYADIGDMQSVIAILTARLEKDPTNLQYKLSLSSAYAQIGQKQKAIDLINQMIVQEPRFKDQGQTYIKQLQSGQL